MERRAARVSGPHFVPAASGRKEGREPPPFIEEGLTGLSQREVKTVLGQGPSEEEII